VLGRGIPNQMRQDFEDVFFEGHYDVLTLAKQFPGIANAYSPEQWRNIFESQLGNATSFGAVWGLYGQE